MQKQEITDTLSGIANKYGALPIFESIDFEHFITGAETLSRNEIAQAIVEAKGKDFVITQGLILSTRYDEAHYPDIFLSYYEFPVPNKLTSNDVVGWSDGDHLPLSDELKAFIAYCSQASTKENKEDLIKQLPLRFFASFNGVTVREQKYILLGVEEFLGIEANETMQSLFDAAALMQPSWYNAGQRAIDRKKDQWLDPKLESGELTLRKIDEVEKFTCACANYYGYIERRAAYRIYKSMEGKDAVSRECFNLIIDNAPNSMICKIAGDSIMSFELYTPNSAKYWDDAFKTEAKAKMSDTLGTQYDERLFSLLWLMNYRAGEKRGYFVPSREEFYQYTDYSYIPKSHTIDEIIQLLKLDTTDQSVMGRFHFIFNHYAHTLGNARDLFIADLSKDFGLDHLSSEEKGEAIVLFMKAIDELPAWERKGYSAVQDKHQK